MLAQNSAARSRPSYSWGIGGIDTKTSSVMRATIVSRSPASYAATNRATKASSTADAFLGRAARREGGPRTLQRAGHRGDGRVQHVGDLVGVEPEDVAQHQD